jgi:hypothetical protein
MWFALGIVIGGMIGGLAGCGTCIRYLRREIAADIGPRLRRIQLQLDNLETAVNLGVVTRYADMAAGFTRLPATPHQMAPPVTAVPPRTRAPEPPFAA